MRPAATKAAAGRNVRRREHAISGHDRRRSPASRAPTGASGLALYLPFIILIPSLIASLRLRLRLHRLDALHLAFQLVAAAELRLCRLRALRLALAEPPLEHRLHQPLRLRRALRDRRDGDRPAARHPDRPARARRSGLADDLPLSACRLLRRHRHGLELALQPGLRHRVLRASASASPASSFRGPPTASSRSTRSSSPASGRHRASRWRCSWRGCARSTRT